MQIQGDFEGFPLNSALFELFFLNDSCLGSV